MQSGSRGTCALRAGSATSGSTSTCGMTGRPAERCTGACGTAARSATRTPGGRRVAAPGRVDIRPGEEKSRVGDWEGDTGARHRGAVPSLVDRASKFTLLALPGGRTAGETGEAMRRRLGAVRGVRAHNGQRQGVRGPQGGCRGARRSSSRSRTGSAERATGWFASRRRPASWTPPNRVENLLNNRPRKALDYRTPAEVFKRTLTGGPAPLKRNLTRLPARLAGARSRNGPVRTRAAGLRGSHAAASRAGLCSGIAGRGQTTCRPGALTHRLGGLA